MGRGASKLDHRKGEMLPKLPPILCRKLEEIRRRRAGATLSKKQLLKDGDEDECASIHHNERKSLSSLSSPEPDEDSIGSAKVAPEPTEPKEIFSDQEVIDQEKSTEQNNNKDNNNAEEEDKEKVEELALEETEDEEYGRFSNVEGSLICPGSPSFRVYYIESLQNKEDNGKDDYMNKGSLSDTDVDAVETVESGKSTEESVAKIKKRGRKGMKFRRVGGPVKNFLNVKSCYYPSCGGLEISRLIAAKPATT
ncbi:hypothetical protein QQP08_010523 [Theobroma cacao]|nr:hypothetical protein QQP08_010523 [Theobroma cacao]